MQKLSRSELSKKYNISRNAWEARHNDLLDWIRDFFPIEEVKEGRYYYYLVIDDLPESIPKLPRKSNKEEKMKDYVEFVIRNLPEDFEPFSKALMARKAIESFGKEKYHHTSYRAVNERYVGPAMELYGEKSEEMVWVFADSYAPLPEEMEEYLHYCFNYMHITEQVKANAFDKYMQGEEITEETTNYEKAIDMYKERYVIRPIKVNKWRAKKIAIEKYLQYLKDNNKL